MHPEQVLQYVLAGITEGAIYAIIAIGFNIIYNTTGIINFAQGEFLVLGAMTAVSLSAFLPLPLAVAAAVAVTMAVGALVDLVFIRWLASPSVLRLVVITIGVSILLREGMLHVWDEKVRALRPFSGSEISSVNVFGAHIAPQALWVLGIAALIVAGLALFFRYTLAGRAMRACAANSTAARLCGINTRRLVTLSFCLSAGIGALAGCALSPLTQTQYDMGAPLAIKGFTVAILGGLGNSTAAVAAGLILGLLEVFSVSLLPLAYKDAVSLAVLLIVLFLRPGGLFGSLEAQRLKEF
jgi:branched-chain amino acid transport system permease protein